MGHDSWLNEVNMINCSRQRRIFFEKYGSIDGSLLVAYWMMAGYLDPVESVEEGYETGFNTLMELKRKRIVSESLNKISASTCSDLNCCSHKGHCNVSNLGFDYLLDLRQLAKLTLEDGVLRDEEGLFLLLDSSLVLDSSALTSLTRFKYIVCFLAHPDMVKALLGNYNNNPSMMLLRDCKNRCLKIDSIENLMSLSVLEISGVASLSLDIPEFTSLPLLNLSESIPDLIELQCLYLSGIIPVLTQLQCLNLSGTNAVELPVNFFSELKQLRWLVLRKCPNLKTLPSLDSLINLQVLDLYGSRALGIFAIRTIASPMLQILEFSGTAMTTIPQLKTTKLNHLLMRFSELRAFRTITHPRSIQLLDLSFAHRLQLVDLSQLDDLQVLDLSYTEISSIDSVKDKVHLRKLILQGCKALKKLPALEKLESLEVLDVSCCEQLIHMPNLGNQTKLEVLDLSKTQLNRLPSFANPSHLRKLSLRNLELDSLETLSSLTELVELDLFNAKISSSVGFLEFLENLRTLNLSQTCVVDLPALTSHIRLKELFLADCPHLTTLPNVNTLRNLDRLVLKDGSDASGSDQPFRERVFANIDHALQFVASAATPITGNENTHMRQLKTVKMDLECIKNHKDRLKDSPNFNRACELLLHLRDLQHLPKLAQTAAKLKLLLPRMQTFDSESLEHVMKKKEPKFFSTGDEMNANDDIIKKLIIPKATQAQMESLLSTYESLTSNEKHCLLCFSIFPLHVHEGNHKEVLLGKNLEMRKKMLIYWWVGEGFIDIRSEQVTSVDKGKIKKTIEEVGEEILRVLTDKGFIQPVIRKSRETRRCCMGTFVHSFVTQQAKQEKYFNFSNKNGKLTPLLKSSHTACLLRSQDRIPSSCHFWAVYAKSPDKLKRFKNLKTLFNVDESVIHIQPQWFFEMKDLHVLHLGNWHSGDPEHIEVRDKTFMENLKRVKQLRFFSLQGVSTIAKLPDSVCKLANLIILDLKECHELEELPADIGSLKNLTHLDISNCHLLTKLPKGVGLLSKLEVLKGFVIYEQLGDSQDIKENILGCSYKGRRIHDLMCWQKNEVCTLRDLLKLQNLRKLSIVVNNECFPNSEKLEVLRQMKNLHKLKISWEKNLKDDKKSYSSSRQGDDSRSAQDKGKNKHVEKKPREFLDQIEKLELCCFPNKTAPDWFVPDELENLKKLYILGGKLEKLPERSSSKEWNVEMLRLRYLPDLTISWNALRAMFPKMTYLDKCKCRKLHFYPCDSEGVWMLDYE